MRQESTLSAQTMDTAWARRVCRVLLTLPVAIVMAPILIAVGFTAYFAVIPSYSAEVHLAHLKTTVSVRLYRVLWTGNNGRSVTVRAPGGNVTFQPCGMYWTYDPSTSIALVNDRTLAIRGWEACHALISLDTGRVERTLHANPSDWLPLGAFTIAVDEEGIRDLRFVPTTSP